MRIAEDGQAVGLQGQHVVDRARERVGGLVRQAEDKVDADRMVALRAHPVERLAGNVHRLKAVDRQLHLRVGVLHPE